MVPFMPGRLNSRLGEATVGTRPVCCALACGRWQQQRTNAAVRGTRRWQIHATPLPPSWVAARIRTLHWWPHEPSPSRHTAIDTTTCYISAASSGLWSSIPVAATPAPHLPALPAQVPRIRCEHGAWQ